MSREGTRLAGRGFSPSPRYTSYRSSVEYPLSAVAGTPAGVAQRLCEQLRIDGKFIMYFNDSDLVQLVPVQKRD